MTNVLNRWLPAATLACWGAILLYFHLSGRLSAFLHPAFRPGVFVAGVLLLLFATGSAWGGGVECCDADASCGHSVTRPTAGKLLAFAVLLIPLGVAFGTSKDGFGLAAMQNRGVVMDASGIAGKPASGSYSSAPYKEDALPTNGAAVADASGNTGTAEQFIPKTASGNIAASVIDLLYAAQDASLRSDFEGKTVEVIGQLMAAKDANPLGNRMKVVRMFMTCCAADAKPIAALVELPAGTPRSDAPELSWVRVVGIPTFPMEGGRNIAVLKANSVTATAPPEETMLY